LANKSPQKIMRRSRALTKSKMMDIALDLTALNLSFAIKVPTSRQLSKRQLKISPLSTQIDSYIYEH
jgi:hypothetical protein